MKWRHSFHKNLMDDKYSKLKQHIYSFNLFEFNLNDMIIFFIHCMFLQAHHLLAADNQIPNHKACPQLVLKY